MIISTDPYWIWYGKDDNIYYDRYRCGKWMYFFNDFEFAKKICEKAVKEGAIDHVKHSNNPISGVICFYLHCDDVVAHKKIISFFIENRLIRRKKNGDYYNISFKLDSQTRKGEYEDKFEGKLTLEKIIDLSTGEFIIDDALSRSPNLFEEIFGTDIFLGQFYNIKVDKDKYGYETADKYILRALPSIQPTRIRFKDTTAVFWSGNYIPPEAENSEYSYIIRFASEFDLKVDKEPFIVNRFSSMHPLNEPMITSRVFNKKDGKYYDRYIDFDKSIQRSRPIIFLTKEDYELFVERYDVLYFEVLDGCYFIKKT